jgi:hypothetical protein
MHSKIAVLNKTIMTAITILAVFFISPSVASAWTIHKDFEAGVVGTSAQGQEDGFSSDSGGSEYVDHLSSLGEQSVELNVREGTAGFGYWGGVINFPSNLNQGDEIWISLRLFIPEGFDFSTNTGVLKFLRIRQRAADGSHTGYLDNLIRMADSPRGVFTLLKEGQNSLFSYGERGVDDIPYGRWFRFELYAYLDETSQAQGGQAVVRTWIDDKLLTEERRIETLSTSGTTATSLYLFTYWNGGAPKTQHLYVDDIIITNEQPVARDQFSNPMIGKSPYSADLGTIAPPDAPNKFIVN